MRKIVIFLGVMAILIVAGCSSSKSSNKFTEQDSIANIVAQKLIEERNFVLVAQSISIGVSPTITVTGNSNFIMVDGDECTIQVAPRNGIAGAITAKGSVSGYRVETNKRGETNVSFHFVSKIGSGDVNVTMYDHSTSAMANINATFWRGRSSMRGTISAAKRTTIVLPK